MTIDRDKLRAAYADDDRGGTHWDGCELVHPRCAVRRLLEELETLRARLAEVEAAATRSATLARDRLHGIEAVRRDWDRANKRADAAEAELVAAAERARQEERHACRGEALRELGKPVSPLTASRIADRIAARGGERAACKPAEGGGHEEGRLVQTALGEALEVTPRCCGRPFYAIKPRDFEPGSTRCPTCHELIDVASYFPTTPAEGEGGESDAR